ncbi:hypothetical protein ACPCW1_19200, partial [Bacillus pumilus]|uniref:hypothetical protein n=1 Tax=Bacillus pumilus TaxID=1408 RepID=UPI003C24E553
MGEKKRSVQVVWVDPQPKGKDFFFFSSPPLNLKNLPPHQTSTPRQVPSPHSFSFFFLCESSSSLSLPPPFAP